MNVGINSKEKESEIKRNQESALKKNLSIAKEEYMTLKLLFKMKGCFPFYNKHVGRVEIVLADGSHKLVYFQKPFVTKFITKNIKSDVIFKTNRTSDQSRVEHLIDNFESYEWEMKYNQSLAKYYVNTLLILNNIKKIILS